MLSMLGFVAGITAQEDANCPGAPQPRLLVGGQGRVTPGDPNNVRDAAAPSGTKVGEIPGGEVFFVLEGPVCTDGLNWWRVSYDDLTGWTVEGQGNGYWVEPFDTNQPTTTTPPPTEVPTATPLPAPAHVFEPLRPVVNVLTSGVQARVISDDPSNAEIRLTVRKDAGVDGEVITRLNAGDQVTILDGVQEVDSLIWREVALIDGRQGWTIEGVWYDSSGRYERTLLPACPATANRIAFFFSRYIYTANPDGSEACVMDKLLLPEVHTFYRYYVYLPNKMIWSPDHTAFAYVDFPETADSNQELFILSADGMERRQITNNGDGGDVYWVDWSPDGQRLAIAQQIAVPGTPQIWTMRTDGSAYGALTSGSNRKLWAAWLADSATLVYVENIGESRNQIGPTPQEFIFYTINVEHGGLSELFRTNLDLITTSLSPDRSQLLIQGWETEALPDTTRYVEYTGIQTILIDMETREATVLPGNSAYDLMWLPDGSGLVGVRDNHIIVASLPDAEPVVIPLSPPIATNSYKFPVDWLPNGQLAVINGGRSFISNDDNELLAVNIGDGTVQTLIGAVQPK